MCFKKIKPVNVKLIHYGFSSPELIESKYKMYKNLGQSGFALERFIDESGLRIRPFRKEWFPPSILK